MNRKTPISGGVGSGKTRLAGSLAAERNLASIRGRLSFPGGRLPTQWLTKLLGAEDPTSLERERNAFVAELPDLAGRVNRVGNETEKQLGWC